MNLYKILWSTIGGRPWTYIYRDIYHKYEWFMHLQWFVIGMVVALLFGWRTGLAIFGIYTFGYINGHFFWGRDWIAGQRGK